MTTKFNFIRHRTYRRRSGENLRAPYFRQVLGRYTSVQWRLKTFLANVNSRSRSLYAVARPSVVCLSVVCLSSVTLVQAQAVIFLAIFLRYLVPWPSIDNHRKFYGDRPRGTPPPGELNTTVVAKYSDFGPISETVQDRRKVSINH